MGLISDETFVCIDCETTGLDIQNDHIIELAAAKFTFSQILEQTETLVNPQISIPQESRDIHKISDEMVAGAPLIKDILPEFLKLADGHILIGHGIPFDIGIIASEAKRWQIPCHLQKNLFIDTLRLARLYGESPINSLERLRHHFNIPEEGAHRAMNDVIVNIEVFKRLCLHFKTTEALLLRMQKPVLLKNMPLGKHKGRPFPEIPTAYLQWAAGKDFDMDLLYSIRRELKQRKQGTSFQRSGNPFSGL